MCTSITIKTNDNNVILGRTMDCPTIPFNVIYAPRNFHWKSTTYNEPFTSKYAFMGLSADIPLPVSHPYWADGINECGLMCAQLTLTTTTYADYKDDKSNLESLEIILWMLSQCSSVQDVLDKLDTINILPPSLPEFRELNHFHWIVSDKTNRTVILENTASGVNIYSDSICTLTNDPAYPEQVKNLNNYLPYSPEIFVNEKLPGDFSSISRFVRAALLRQSITNASNEKDGMLNVYKILDNVSYRDEIVEFPGLPGNVYTVLSTAMCANSGCYYVKTYGNSQINKFSIFNENLNGSDIVKYNLSQYQAFN